MPRHQRLKPVLEITQAQQEQAARQLAQITQQRDAARRQLKQLQDYLAEYERLGTDPKRAVNPSLLENQRAFIDKLKAGIHQQEAKVAQLERRVEQYAQRWNASRTRAESLEKVIQTYASAYARDQDRRTQRELDDLAGTRPQPKVD